MSNKKTYWKGLPELKNDLVAVKNSQNEFGSAPEGDSGHSRRDFLKLMGFSVAAASLAACETPIRKAIPYVNKPMDVDPGIPNYYASSYVQGGDYCSIVVKTREGRPIKIDGNSLSKVTQGGTSAQVEASVLSLYDNYRLRGPKIADAKAKWETVDSQVIEKLAAAQNIRIVSNTILSPSTKAAIEVFKSKYPSTQHIQYDPASSYGIVKANAQSFGGNGFIPSYDFSKAMTIVSVAADFLGTWLAPIIFTKQYAVNRAVSVERPVMSRHYQFESILSLTGANADYREMIKPSQEGLVVGHLYNLIASKAGQSALSVAQIEDAQVAQTLVESASELWENRGKSLVVAGSNDSDVQVIVNAINTLLGNYGTTILPSKPMNFRQGNDEQMDAFIADVEGGKVDAVIFYNSNPVYDHPKGAKLGAALKNIALTISTQGTEDETSSLCGYKTPDHHYLESWNDFEPVKNSFSLSQPAITKIFSTRQAQESFMIWAGVAAADAEFFTFIKKNWTSRFFGAAGGGMDQQSFWDKCLYDGVLDIAGEESVGSFNGDVAGAGARIASNYSANNTEMEVVVYEPCSIGTGAQANNPLLQELPDPITKAVWDHYITISLADAKTLGIENDAEGRTQFVTISANNSEPLKVAALVQPGQKPGTVGIALGYGRTKVGKVGMGETGNGIGVNAYVLVGSLNGSLNYSASKGVKLEVTKEDFQLAQTQIHHTHMNRENVIQETTFAEFKENPYAGRHEPHITNWAAKNEEVAAKSLSMWKGHKYENHHWGMAIDMNSCTGCGACVVACNVENNVAIVGKTEVINRREMHWLRIDRYYSAANPETDDYKKLEIAAENPEVIFQPMLCQHCNNASCETVCPVAATTHSTEGLNQMTYNRCVGTRYCANNCPYKVRRFNWFKYHDNQKFAQSHPAANTDLGRMVLNPDVTVRSRGVMEKCSFCVQRIQYAKLNAKKERRPMKDGEATTACAAACTTGAIVFGDMNNPESAVSQLLKITVDTEGASPFDKKANNPRAYRVLEDVGVKPNIFYLNKIKNKRPRTA